MEKANVTSQKIVIEQDAPDVNDPASGTVREGKRTWELRPDQFTKHESTGMFGALSKGDRAAARDSANEFVKEMARRG